MLVKFFDFFFIKIIILFLRERGEISDWIENHIYLLNKRTKQFNSYDSSASVSILHKRARKQISSEFIVLAQKTTQN